MSKNSHYKKKSILHTIKLYKSPNKTTFLVIVNNRNQKVVTYSYNTQVREYLTNICN